MELEYPKTYQPEESMDDSSFPIGDEYFSPSFSLSSLVSADLSGSPVYNSIDLSAHDYPSYSSYAVSSTSARPYTPPDGVSPPALYSLSAGDMSSDGATNSEKRGSGTHSPPLRVSYEATVPRSQRYNALPTPATRATRGRSKPTKRRRVRSDSDDEEEDEEFHQSQDLDPATNESRREIIRRQRIDSEQRRRDDLRDGYAHLRNTLPPSNQKQSKVALLDRACTYIKELKVSNERLRVSLQRAEGGRDHALLLNETLMLRQTNGQR